MIRNICKDEKILSLVSEEATKEDVSIGQDLLDTLQFHKDKCVGMAANMISFSKRIIVFTNEGKNEIMYNPRIVKTFGEPYSVEEGCLSLKGVRLAKRYKKIQVEFFNSEFKKMQRTYSGFTCQIIQHEIDHLHGIII
ncbi:MAG: peptide deformylase [Bacilli bacterium]